ncbi:MAG: hypothetical protein KDJ68_13250 [Rhodobiaceae bacterium]|nr:hypothetical protein [Rhodobiaceae bacterium]
MMIVAFPSGEVDVLSQVPLGSLCLLARIEEEQAKRAIDATAVVTRDGRAWVPGMTPSTPFGHSLALLADFQRELSIELKVLDRVGDIH